MNTIIFVYNAESGLFNLVKDWTHKIISPETYPCSLCALTYDNLGMRNPWRKFIRELEYDVKFLHRDELEGQYGISEVSLPAAFIHRDGKPKLWINSEALDACQSLDDLISLVSQQLAKSL